MIECRSLSIDSEEKKLEEVSYSIDKRRVEGIRTSMAGVEVVNVAS